MNKEITGFTGAALDALDSHAWEGNARELDNTLAKAVFACKGSNLLSAHDIFPEKCQSEKGGTLPTSIGDSEDISEEQMLALVPRIHGNSLSEKLNVLEKSILQFTLEKKKATKQKQPLSSVSIENGSTSYLKSMLFLLRKRKVRGLSDEASSHE